MVAILAGALLGPADLWGQVNTPYPWADLFNSPSVWAAAAFGYGRWIRARPASLVGSVVLLTVAVEAYYLADVLVRDANVANLTSTTAAVWLAAGVAAGLVFGLAGEWAAERSGWRAVSGRAALPSVFGAEAVRNLVRLATEPADGRPADLGQFAVVLGVIAIVLLIVMCRRPDRPTTLRIIALSVVAASIVGGVATAV